MKKCPYSRKCAWGNALNPGYCALNENECELEAEGLAMSDLDADINEGGKNE